MWKQGVIRVFYRFWATAVIFFFLPLILFASIYFIFLGTAWVTKNYISPNTAAFPRSFNGGLIKGLLVYWVIDFFGCSDTIAGKFEEFDWNFSRVGTIRAYWLFSMKNAFVAIVLPIIATLGCVFLGIITSYALTWTSTIAASNRGVIVLLSFWIGLVIGYFVRRFAAWHISQQIVHPAHPVE